MAHPKAAELALLLGMGQERVVTRPIGEDHHPGRVLMHLPPAFHGTDQRGGELALGRYDHEVTQARLLGIAQRGGPHAELKRCRLGRCIPGEGDLHGLELG